LPQKALERMESVRYPFGFEQFLSSKPTAVFRQPLLAFKEVGHRAFQPPPKLRSVMRFVQMDELVRGYIVNDTWR
jgi:hypothetical protein